MIDLDTINEIRDTRRENNDLWMTILAIALQHAPEPTKEVLRAINERDQHISTLLSDLAR